MPVARTISVEPTGTLTGSFELEVLAGDFARMHAGKDDRRLAGISRRRDPGVDAEIRRQHDALPVERRGDALEVFAAGGNEGGDDGNENEAAQRVRIARCQTRRRPAGLERPRRGERALDVRLPQRQRIGVLRRDREFIGNRGRRPMTDAAAAVEPAQRVGGGREPQRHEWNDRGDRENGEYHESRSPGERRQPEP